MFFDRNEIHIQVGVLFNNGKCIIFNSSSPQNYFQNIYSKNIYKKSNFKKNVGLPFENFENFEILILIFTKIIFFQDVPIYFLIFFEVSWPLQR